MRRIPRRSRGSLAHALASDASAMAEATAALVNPAAAVGVNLTRAFSRCGLDKPPGFPLNDAMVKISAYEDGNAMLATVSSWS